MARLAATSSAVRGPADSGASEGPSLRIGDVAVAVLPPARPELVPAGYARMDGADSQSRLRHLRWIMQKDLLGQDVFLIGAPGSLRRRLALQYCELTEREVEYIALSKDTTEADIKQRREIVGGTAHYVDQCAVRAALEGRVLILEGIEKAERNLLPILNNLMENREMHLEDGRFLVAPSRYDALLQTHTADQLTEMRLARVSDRFRIIALGLPVPRFRGNPLDPPLRSRFQARDIRAEGYGALKAAIADAAPLLEASRPDLTAQLVSYASTIEVMNSDPEILDKLRSETHIPSVPLEGVEQVAKILESAPKASVARLLQAVHPFDHALSAASRGVVQDVLARFSVADQATDAYHIQGVNETQSSKGEIILGSHSGETVAVPTTLGTAMVPSSSAAHFVPTESSTRTLIDMLLSHSQSDMCLIGGRGTGKSTLVDQFASLCRYDTTHIMMHKDMTARDLLQQRITLENGDTAWKPSPLITAALEGSLAVLDGIHRVDPGTITVLQRLTQDRQIVLHDGMTLMGRERLQAVMSRLGVSEEAIRDANIHPIHPSFRVIALAEPPMEGARSWLTDELQSMFHFHGVSPLKLAEEKRVVSTLVPDLPEAALAQLLAVGQKLRSDTATSVLANSATLSTRQLLRIARRNAAFPGEPLEDAVRRACLAQFLPTLAREALDQLVAGEGGVSAAQHDDAALKAVVTDAPRGDGRVLDIGGVQAPLRADSNPALVPDVVFYDNPQHLRVMQDMLKDYALGEHLLLVGNQGVGKNKVADRLLQLLNLPREYVQLHRDTTVQTLTQQPSVREGRIVYEDSPLVRAVIEGSVLVVDEADKAPTHVTCILKTLVESGEMTLADGRRIIPHNSPRVDGEGIIRTHEQFRMVFLANRPGFPFLGNDFFGSMGDIFSCHAVSNPSMESELKMLAKYGPDVDPEILRSLSLAFGDLRSMADSGQINYPYSMREVVSVVRHLQAFPADSLGAVVKNVFDFDSYDDEMKALILDAFRKHGIPLSATKETVVLSPVTPLPPATATGSWRLKSTPTSCNVTRRDLSFDASKRQDIISLPLTTSSARADSFTEETRTWRLPFHTGQRLEDIQVASNSSVHVVSSRPPAVYSLSADKLTVTGISLERFFPPYSQRYHPMKLGCLDDEGTRVVVCREAGDDLFVVDTASGDVMRGSGGGLLERTVGRLASFSPSSTTGQDGEEHRRVLTDNSEDGIVFTYNQGGSTLEMVDVAQRLIHTVHLPPDVVIQSVSLVSPTTLHVTAGSRAAEDIASHEVTHFLLTGEARSPPNQLVELTHRGPDGNPRPSGPDAPGLVSKDRAPATLVSMLSPETASVARDAPSRVLGSPDSFAGVALGFPDRLLPGRESAEEAAEAMLYAFPRPTGDEVAGARAVAYCPVTSTLYNVLPPDDFGDALDYAGTLEAVSMKQSSVRRVKIPLGKAATNGRPTSVATSRIHSAVPLPDGRVITASVDGELRQWEMDQLGLKHSLATWQQMIGQGDEDRLQLERYSGKDAEGPKHGKVDDKNEPHVGGNTWQGGTGGRDTAGLGGKGGPYRLDAGHDVHQLSDEEKEAVPEHIKQAAREMGEKAFAERLAEINMSEYDAEVYDRFSKAIRTEVRELKTLLASLEAKGKERIWLSNQTVGDLDDAKLVEGLTGEQTIFRRRGTEDPNPGSFQEHPKLIRFVMDLSASMYRFNSQDQRLQRMLEVSCMIMEAFEGTSQSRIKWEMVGHSGDGPQIPLIDSANCPANEHERLKVLQRMIAHSQFCMSGDYTIEAVHQAINAVSTKEADERFVVVLSDANLDRYGIPASKLGQALTSNPDVHAFGVMVGSLGNQAAKLTRELPAGQAFVCLDTAQLPKIMKQIFTSTLLK